MRIAVVGAGGVGGYFGARLAAAGGDVSFVARGAHLEAMRRDGLRIKSPLGDLTLEQPQTVERIDALGDVDLVIVAVKLWDTETVAASLRPLVERGATVLSLQNGVHKDEILRQHLPAEAVIGGVCYIAAVIDEPGVIRHSGSLQGMVFGEYDGTRSARVQAFHDACIRAGIDARISESIERLIWEKFVFLVGLSGTTSAMRQPIGPIREHPRTRAFLLEVMREAAAVGRAKGVPLREDFADDRLTFADTLPATMTSSMHHDLQRGNRLELPWLSGGVAQFGEDTGIPTPCNRAVADILALYADGAPPPLE